MKDDCIVHGVVSKVERRFEPEKAEKLLMAPQKRAEPVFVEGKGAIVKDAHGKEYIDCLIGNGVASLGHCNPQLVEAIKKQSEKLITCPGHFWHPPMLELVEELSKIMPEHLQKFFFCCSGAEAVEGAMKIATKYCFVKGKTAMSLVALEHSTHGTLGLSGTLTGRKKFKSGLGTFVRYPGVVHIPAPYCYRCELEFPDCGIQCARALHTVINSRGPEDIAALIYEPIIGAGGMIIPPKEYIQTIDKICRENGIVVVADEVFSGMGRTGKMFAFEHFETNPDILVLSKALGGGISIAAFISTKEIGDVLQSSDHASTLGGNPLACAAAVASIRTIRSLGLVENAEKTGKSMLRTLVELKNESEYVGDVRGLGLTMGIEIVEDKKSKKPAPSKAGKLVRTLLENGVIVGLCGAESNVVRINPPLVISSQQAEKTMQEFGKALKAI